METRTIIVLIGLLAGSAVLADAYTWTDENGVVHYSDRPNPGAEKIYLPESGTSRPRPSQSRASDEPDEGASTQPFNYQTLSVASPAAEETLWNIEGTLTVRLALAPNLQPGHRVRVYFDGNPQLVTGTSFQLQEVYRGVHNLQAEVIDETGKLMIRSIPTRFYVQQNSIR